jgi:2-dehydro-3-deoxyphosphogluconate aldolase / (4S)-4-hydroxy-2-oxoglutarate aldolase
MNKAELIQRIRDIGIVPVVRAASAKQALLAAEAVAKGGIPIVEITMTVPGALDAIRQLAQGSTATLVGAGTVLDAASARDCIAAGARFLVSPGFDAGVVAAAREAEIPIMAGALTPTEVMAAVKAQADFIKIFPCSSVGGAAYIKALRGPFPRVSFIPTGGVNLTTAGDFLRAGAAALGIGGELVDSKSLETGVTEGVVEKARRYVTIIQEVRSELGAK